MIYIFILAGIGGLVMLGTVLMLILMVIQGIRGPKPPMDYAERELDSLGERVTRLHREVIAADERVGMESRQ